MQPEPLFPVIHNQGELIGISYEIAKAAYAQYAKDFPNGQTLEQIAKRGGFSTGELVNLLFRSIPKLLAPLFLLSLCGCTVVSANRVFPKLAWYWSRDAKLQREGEKPQRPSQDWQGDLQRAIDEKKKSEQKIQVLPFVEMVRKRDGTNFLGVYMGMIAEWDAVMLPNVKPQGVMMFSATSGELLKWISYEDFRDIFVLRIKQE